MSKPATAVVKAVGSYFPTGYPALLQEIKIRICAAQVQATLSAARHIPP